MKKNDYILLNAEDVYSFCLKGFLKAGLYEDDAELTARGLWHASMRGVDSHGFRLFPHYVRVLESGRVNKEPNSSFIQTSASTGIFDADHGFGHAAGIYAMRHAINLAEVSGTGHVAVKNSTHCGAMAYFALEACRHDMVGIAQTHASPKMRTPNSTRPFFGTNPLCITMPMLEESPLCYDSAPTYITSNKLKMYKEKGDQLPFDLAATDDGQITRDPNVATQLLPIADYKGFGLSMMVDMFCGLFSGMPVGNMVSQMYGDDIGQKRFLGQFYSAIRVDCFEDQSSFKKRLQHVVNALRNEPCVNQNDTIRVPGDPEKECARCREKEGVPFLSTTVAEFDAIAKRYDLQIIGERKVRDESSCNYSC